MESGPGKATRTGDARSLMSTPDPITREIQRAVANIGQLKARQLLREMRSQADAKAKARRKDSQLRFELGALVLRCGLSQWDRDEIAGMLIDGKRHAEESATMRLAFKKHGAALVNLASSKTVH